jgi:hypothetical protein
LETAFAGWLELGNHNPSDWSGADDEKTAFLEAALGIGSPTAQDDRGDSSCCAEISTYLEMIQSLDRGGGIGELAEFLDKLCQGAFSGGRRSRRVLAGTSFLLFGEVAEVPGLDEGGACVEAAKFLLDAGFPEKGAKILFQTTWGTPEAYLLGGLILLDKGMFEEALEAFRIGEGLGDIACGGMLATLVGDPMNIDPKRFRRVQMAAERGFGLPLLLAGWALLTGRGVDADQKMGEGYLYLGGQECPKLPDGWIDSGFPLQSKHSKPPKNFREIVFSWAGKHSQDPIFRGAARLWRESFRGRRP